ncbi:alpha/beta hydrolase [Microterricola pindariensis]|uniref:alpha/beta hydrolase n=1 Tax=Microterricola pindariensis TaxID=478010 RepID=UPI00105705B3|nr:alpha/beta hydrolase fold domain-containing protein [Microterricola pindariensis]
MLAVLDDCYLTLVWMRDNAARLGIRPDQLAVAGASEARGLTAALTLYARDKGEIPVAFELPFCPMIHDRCTTDFAGLAPAFAFVGSIEPFWDETIDYVDKLHAARAPVEFTVFEGCFHGVDDLVPKARVSMEATRYRNRWFGHSIQNCFTPQPVSS